LLKQLGKSIKAKIKKIKMKQNNLSAVEMYKRLFGEIDIKKMLIEHVKYEIYNDVVGKPFTMEILIECVKVFLYCKYSHVVHECQINCKIPGIITLTLFIDESMHVAEILQGNRVEKELCSLLHDLTPMAIMVDIIIKPTPYDKAPKILEVIVI
jgi:hypothetical protein